eukprot:825361-Amorphochlora_amoeboformis.AAC.1
MSSPSSEVPTRSNHGRDHTKSSASSTPTDISPTPGAFLLPGRIDRRRRGGGISAGFQLLFGFESSDHKLVVLAACLESEY